MVITKPQLPDTTRDTHTHTHTHVSIADTTKWLKVGAHVHYGRLHCDNAAVSFKKKNAVSFRKNAVILTQNV